jgi:hypothetical protein
MILTLRDLDVCMKEKTIMFWQKPDIWILDLYFYGVKIQTNIKQNLVEKYTEKLQFFKKKKFLKFFLDRVGPGQSFWVGPGWCCPAQ